MRLELLNIKAAGKGYRTRNKFILFPHFYQKAINEKYDLIVSIVDGYYIWSNVLQIYRQPVGGGGQYLHPYYSGKPCRNESVR